VSKIILKFSVYHALLPVYSFFGAASGFFGACCGGAIPGGNIPGGNIPGGNMPGGGILIIPGGGPCGGAMPGIGSPIFIIFIIALS
jgi:hypothetical protein